ncbi:MAG TPA: 2-oxo-4-hydroxy-4-carboxy-5-ureidoimidazoline decarboxylase [Burkholderiaceae bacterium]|nr:2-oxo-4-hydroxy-4-carboxy-5-ureidoimidazoline decarboxylase [Burkholderiaceae bacterium]
MTAKGQQITLSDLNRLSAPEFTQALSGIFENTSWIPEQVYQNRPFTSVDHLHEAMVALVEKADSDAKLALICEHPELAGRAAVRGELTPESTAEQAGAGLDACTQEEFDTLTVLNQTYREKFGFPFILAVRGHNRASVIAEFRRRSRLTPEQEMFESLRQIYKIARFRLDDLIVE